MEETRQSSQNPTTKETASKPIAKVKAEVMNLGPQPMESRKDTQDSGKQPSPKRQALKDRPLGSWTAGFSSAIASDSKSMSLDTEQGPSHVDSYQQSSVLSADSVTNEGNINETSVFEFTEYETKSSQRKAPASRKR
eukprot:TRINITY_DN4388_c0_g1_i1.p1 TRINITY_DN4388_c0_g1~~TRINITY_DN4388_c0_g1_i1.p1  ORF type:complete len:137 (+),score=24.47 TRINITY_DN4388_c0_g1_i1:107-517(+)